MLRISGRVLDAAGRPVGGARVVVTEAPAPVPDIALVTGPDGGFIVSVPAPGRYRLTAATDAATGDGITDLAEGATPALDIRLGPAR